MWLRVSNLGVFDLTQVESFQFLDEEKTVVARFKSGARDSYTCELESDYHEMVGWIKKAVKATSV